MIINVSALGPKDGFREKDSKLQSLIPIDVTKVTTHAIKREYTNIGLFVIRLLF